jgi:hypothetical protein
MRLLGMDSACQSIHLIGFMVRAGLEQGDNYLIKILMPAIVSNLLGPTIASSTGSSKRVDPIADLQGTEFKIDTRTLLPLSKSRTLPPRSGGSSAHDSPKTPPLISRLEIFFAERERSRRKPPRRSR